jgi:hypothetical protein
MTAMLVSVLVGAIRAIAEFRRMIGCTKGGFSTALAAHFTADGSVSIANLGHLAPYLDGIEVQLAGALLLGLASDLCYEVCRPTHQGDMRAAS